MSIINNKLQLIFKRKTFHQLLGAYHSNFKGSGLTYKESRPYVAWDPYHRIDRRTTAKKQDLYVKEFEEERMLRVLFVIHGWESMYFSTQSPTKIDLITQLGSWISALTLQQWDSIGYYLQGDKDPRYIPGKKTNQQLAAFHHHIAHMRFSASHTPDQIAQQLATYRIRHHLIVWCSDILITTPQPHLHALARTNDLLYCHIYDPFERDADPKRFHAHSVRVQYEHNIQLLSQQDQSIYQQKFTEHIHMMYKQLGSWWITSLSVSTEDTPARILSELFEKHSHTNKL